MDRGVNESASSISLADTRRACLSWHYTRCGGYRVGHAYIILEGHIVEFSVNNFRPECD